VVPRCAWMGKLLPGLAAYFLGGKVSGKLSLWASRSRVMCSQLMQSFVCVLDCLSRAFLARGHQMRIRAERQAGVRVAEVLDEGLDDLSSVPEHRGVEVPGVCMPFSRDSA
jgi:predicted alpha/beta-hydrolase family hydrolase